MAQHWLQQYRYHALVGTYVIVTGSALLRISRQPYTRSMKLEQMETIFKGTSLAAIVAGIAMGGKFKRARSSSHQDTNQDRS